MSVKIILDDDKKFREEKTKLYIDKILSLSTKTLKYHSKFNPGFNWRHNLRELVFNKIINEPEANEIIKWFDTEIFESEKVTIDERIF